ncbi:hypothetical protein [Thalassobacillus sp. B23F22_16]|uniref:hypothetical protein n=1 Tax=Thalassobacillus sp. B23F22_16 TaxID=3459513 RepID=UPI00373F7B21
MTKERKEIILQEIQYWKANRLLPESYCDYLLALYTQGEGLTHPSPGPRQWVIVTRIMIAFLMLPISFLVIYFTETAFIMQTGILSIFVLGTGLTAVYLYNKKSIDFSMYATMGLLLLLLWNVHIISLWQAPNHRNGTLSPLVLGWKEIRCGFYEDDWSSWCCFCLFIYVFQLLAGLLFSKEDFSSKINIVCILEKDI